MTARTHCVVVPVLLLAACTLEGTPEVPEGTLRENAVSDVVQFRGRVHFRAQGVDCIDQDGDGAGAYCSGGADCDDTDPAVQTGCTDCADPAAGCPCVLDAPDVPCTVRLGGDCMQGSLRCQDGRYACGELGPLDREIPPGESSPAGFRRYAFTGDPCDSCDLTCRNDPRVPGCPGINPDSPCTTSATCSLGRVCDRGYCSCTSNAQCPAGQQCIGSYCIAPASCTGDPTPDETFDHVGYDPMPPGGFRPGITIGRGTTVFSRYAWVANSGQNTVSKVCLEECPDAWNPMLMHPAGSEVGRYLVGYDGISNNPSRTAIDGLGNAFVANRAHSASNQGSVTAFAGDWSYCDPMRNGDMVLQTSTGGLTGTANWLSRFTAGLPTDECVRWTIPIGANYYIPRALTIGPARPGQNAPGGWIYVGTWHRTSSSGPGRVYKVHPNGCVANRAGCEPATGNWTASGTTAPNGGSVLIPLHPYGAVSFEDGDIWLQQLGVTGYTGVNTDDGTTTSWFTPPAGTSPNQLGMMNAGYGISQDQHHRVWQSGWDEQAMTFYDPGVRDALAASTPLNTALTSTAGDSWCHVDLSASQTESLNYSGGL
ncbi:MAG: hypothetical protein IT379_28185, partial [Deltaproteobacteria bacterium]|nr:hypothetical protein [Deltaproteobacteria bacterium]